MREWKRSDIDEGKFWDQHFERHPEDKQVFRDPEVIVHMELEHVRLRCDVTEAERERAQTEMILDTFRFFDAYDTTLGDLVARHGLETSAGLRAAVANRLRDEALTDEQREIGESLLTRSLA